MRKLVLAAAMFLAAIVSLIADPLLPAGDEMTWEYQSTETNTGDPNPVRSIITVRGSKEQFEGREVMRLETIDAGNKTLKTELASVDDHGIICLARAGQSGPVTKLATPEAIVRAPLKVGAKWEQQGEAVGIQMRQRWIVVGEETVTVPASQYQAFHLRCEDSALISVKLDRWFAPGVGVVKEVTVVKAPGTFHRVTLELQKLMMGSPKPEPTAEAAPPSTSPPVPPELGETGATTMTPTQGTKLLTVEVSSDSAGGLKTEFKSNVPNIYVRWHGHGLPKDVTVRVAWIAEDVGDLVEPNFVVDETETVASTPDASARFTLSRPEDGWAEGKYRVEFYVDDKLTETVRVTIGK